MKKSSITWHYRLSDPDYGKLQANECKSEMTLVLDSYPVEILEGKKNLEVRPHHINKGEIVSILLAQRGECDFILC